MPFWTGSPLHVVPQSGPIGRVKSPSSAVTVDGIAVPPEPTVDDRMNCAHACWAVRGGLALAGGGANVSPLSGLIVMVVCTADAVITRALLAAGCPTPAARWLPAGCEFPAPPPLACDASRPPASAASPTAPIIARLLVRHICPPTYVLFLAS